METPVVDHIPSAGEEDGTTGARVTMAMVGGFRTDRGEEEVVVVVAGAGCRGMETRVGVGTVSTRGDRDTQTNRISCVEVEVRGVDSTAKMEAGFHHESGNADGSSFRGCSATEGTAWIPVSEPVCVPVLCYAQSVARRDPNAETTWGFEMPLESCADWSNCATLVMPECAIHSSTAAF